MNNDSPIAVAWYIFIFFMFHFFLTQQMYLFTTVIIIQICELNEFNFEDKNGIMKIFFNNVLSMICKIIHKFWKK